jgi:hypothetical protein
VFSFSYSSNVVFVGQPQVFRHEFGFGQIFHERWFRGIAVWLAQRGGRSLPLACKPNPWWVLIGLCKGKKRESPSQDAKSE